MGREEIDIIAPAIATLRGGGHRHRRAPARRHDVPCRGARALRRRADDVPRPGPDPRQDAGLRRGRQRHARPAVRAHLARPRHRLRHRRQGARRSREPHRGARSSPRGLRSDARRATGCRRCAKSSRRMGSTGEKSLGQNFLFDLNLTGRIARAAGPLEGVDRHRGRPGTRRPHARAAGRRRAKGRSRSSATRAASRRWPRSPRIGRDGSRSIAGDALAVDFAALARTGGRAGPGLRQPALQHRDAAAGRLARDRALAAVVRPADADVPARGRRAHRRDAGDARRLWPPRRARGLALSRRASCSTCRPPPSRRRRR